MTEKGEQTTDTTAERRAAESPEVPVQGGRRSEVLTTINPDDFRIQLAGRRVYTGGVIGESYLRSVTSIKPEKVFKSRTPWGSLASLDALRAAEWVVDHRHDLDGYLDERALIEDIALAPDRWLDDAGGRGTRIHDVIATEVLAA